MHNGKYWCHIAARCAYHRTTITLLPAAHGPYQNAYLFTKTIEEFDVGTVRMGQKAEKRQASKSNGCRQKSREEIVKWNQIAALRF